MHISHFIFVDSRAHTRIMEQYSRLHDIWPWNQQKLQNQCQITSLVRSHQYLLPIYIPNLKRICITLIKSHTQENFCGGGRDVRCCSWDNVHSLMFMNIHEWQEMVHDPCSWEYVRQNLWRFISELWWILNNKTLIITTPVKCSSWLYELFMNIHECSWTVHEKFIKYSHCWFMN